MSCGSFTASITNPDPNATETEIICRGSDPRYQSTNWYEYWSQNGGAFCGSVFRNILYSGFNTDTNIGRQYNPNEIQRIRDNFSNIFAVFQQSNPITTINDPNFNPFQELILNTCSSIPGACSDFQTPYCQNCSRATIASNSTTLKLCGCNAPALPVEYNISNSACDPLCNRTNSIQNINVETGAVQLCANNVCVIDDINITATQNSTVEGGIIFSQLCSCKASCNCIISGININDTLIESGLTNNVQFRQSCANATCYADDANGNLQPVVCPTNAVFTAPSVPVKVDVSLIILILSITLIVIIGIFIYFRS